MNCIFGIFDVLGFKSFCENCDFQSAGKVLEVMDDFETEIPEILLHGLDSQNDTSQEKIDLVKRRLQWLTFSDTIFVAMPICEADQPDTTKFNLIFITVLTAYINRKMFELGLPVRGTLHIGDAIVSKRCFAGKAIIEAYNLSKNCQIAATIVSDKAHEHLLKVFAGTKLFQSMYVDLVVEHDVPIETKDEEKRSGSLIWTNSTIRLKTLCWFVLGMGRIEGFQIPMDLDSYVRIKFTSHGKKLTGHKETMKAVNTGILFQAWKHATSKMQYRPHISITASIVQAR